MFRAVDLYTVYGAWWFLLILAFLVASTTLCIARNAPKILADLGNFKEHLREQGLQAFHLKAQGTLHGELPMQAVERISHLLSGAGWRLKVDQRCEWWRDDRGAGAVPRTSSATSQRIRPSCWCASVACSTAT